ncbi:hypothetical protein [Natronorubrum daqingense]|uniref:Uncharacterized protein n=1 Tax=Natronorubrum daqingense TaxID=588898 RepID=A0A1N7D190_9EURY|nr:hypothetical protein [Natronorubrum daqingense]APX97159.1 hypothetical protein BB347_11300 [Natronorubrum daqingense]SIR69656.1 hypothetical protein SAMN05421809_1994 [Natronorubrum daqingense]
MSDPDQGQSRVENNRLAITVVVGSLIVAALVVVLVRSGWIDLLVPEHGPAADALPLYVLVAVVLFVLVVWSWSRLFSWFS